MRILMLNNEYPPLGGGTGTVNKTLLEYLVANTEHEIDLITSSRGREPELEQLSQFVRMFKVPVNNLCIHHSTLGELARYSVKGMLLAMKLQREQNYDFVFAWSTVPAGAIALILRKITGIHYVVRLTGPDIPGFEQRYQYLYPFLKPIIVAVWRGASHVIAKCEEEVTMAQSSDSRIQPRIIPNGVWVRRREEERSRHTGQLRMISVGRLIERKGHSTVIRAMKMLVDEGEDVVLDLIGDGDFGARLKLLTRELGLSERIRFHGYIERESIDKYYQQADVFVLASENEGMSVAALEALGAGLPLVLSKPSCAGGMLEEGKNGFSFECGDYAALVHHLRVLCSDPSILRQMSKVSRDLACKMSWERVFSEYDSLFKSMVGT